MFNTDHITSAVFCLITSLLLILFIVGVSIDVANVNEECPDSFNGNDCVDDGLCTLRGDEFSCTCGINDDGDIVCVEPFNSVGAGIASFGSIWVITFFCGVLPFFAYGIKFKNGTKYNPTKVFYTIIVATSICVGIAAAVGGILLRNGTTTLQQLIGLILAIVSGVLIGIVCLCCYIPTIVIFWVAAEEAETTSE